MTRPCPATPGFCSACDRRVRWADIQSCQAGYVAAKSCLGCLHAGAVINDASGAPVGSKGCGCTPESKASGHTWVTCGLSGGPARIDKANRCQSYEAK